MRCGGSVGLTAHGGQVDVTVPAVAVVDTVGAGDAFMSGLIAGLHDHGVTGAEGLDGIYSFSDLRVPLLESVLAGLQITPQGAPQRHPLRPEVYVRSLRSVALQSPVPAAVRNRWMQHLGEAGYRDLAKKVAQELTKTHPDLVLWQMTKHPLTDKGIEAVREWLKRKNLVFPELVLENGAGLSREEAEVDANGVVGGGTHLAPEELHALVDAKRAEGEEVVFFDGRNAFEAQIGRFKDAIVPDVATTHDFIKELDSGKYDALSLRERAMVFAAVMVAVLAFAYTMMIEPQLVQQRRTASAILLGAAALAVAACGSDSDSDAESTEAPAATEAPARPRRARRAPPGAPSPHRAETAPAAPRVAA